MQLILGYLFDKDVVNKSQIGAVVSSPPILSRELEKMENEGLVSIREARIGRKTYYVQLTPIGRLIAQKLKDANDMVDGAIRLEKLPDKSFFSPQQRAIMYIGDEGEAILSNILEEAGCSSDDLSSLEDTGFIAQKIENVRGGPENFIVLTPKGIRAERKLREFAEEPKETEGGESGN